MDTKALRQKILDLAIRGRLVPQDPNDEPASVLLEKIREEKKQMVKEGKLKAKDIKNDTIIFKGEDNLHYEKFQDGTVKCIEDEIPFEVPESWKWCRFRNISTLMSGTTYPAEDELPEGKCMYVKVGDMNLLENTREIVNSSRFLNNYNENHLIPVGSVIFPKRGGAILTNKKRLVLKKEILVDLNTMAFTPLPSMDLMYCYFWFMSFDLGELNSGSSVPQINNKDIEPLLIPIPPYPEQLRIVASIVPILREEENLSVAKGEIGELVEQARAKILDYAIRGQLVAQDPNDEPASVLLKRIRTEKDALIKQGKLRHDKKESVIYKGDDNSYYELVGNSTKCIDDEIPFEVPNGWSWARGKNIFVPMESRKPTGETFDYIDIDSIDNKNNIVTEPKHLLSSEAPSRASRAVFNGSVVFSTVRPYLKNIAYIDERLVNCIASTGFYICTSNGALYPQYMFLLMISRYVVNGLNQYMKGDNSPSINKDDIDNWLFPIPPYNEQIRIQEKVHTYLNNIIEIGTNLL